ncbi:TetR/AcrR family transcriptional regulator [Planomonospora corallina]|uniref:TetR/AcrR family transcriptional regulator n=1 Tax=Planomonospora corallina TaxID=1806052 RepID=A0ABV8I654_9ACTN
MHATRTDGDTRSRVLSVFAAHFAVHGYQGTSLQAVAQEAGVKKPTLYHHFPGGKETLYNAVALDSITERGELLARALAVPGGLADQLTAVIEACADPTGSATSFDQRIFDALPHVDTDIRDELSSVYVERILSPVQERFRRAVDDGELSPADPALLCNAFLHLARAIDMAGDDRHEAAAALTALFLDGARGPRPAAA